MNKLKINPTVIVRSPRFSYDLEKKTCWEELKILIKEASPDFYERIRNLSFDELNNAEHRIQDTVNKYFNRSKFRSTPFGSFASVGLAELKPGPAHLRMENGIHPHYFHSWSKRNTNPVFTKKECLKGELKFFSNTTFYGAAQEIRFIKKEDSVFQIASIDFDLEVDQLLLYCRNPRTFSEINNHISSIGEPVLFKLLKDLVGIQLILTSKHSNIIGEDYLQKNANNDQAYDRPYIISERKFLSKNINSNAFKHLPELASKLQSINSNYKNDTLERFITDFNKKFEGLEIPLSVALDPDVGIGYGDFATRNTNGIMDKFVKKENDSLVTRENYLLNSDIIKLIVDTKDNNTSIQLDSILTDSANNLPLPNSIGVLCTQVDDTIYIDSMGGSTSNALAGRFAFAVPEILDHCVAIAKLEEDANPDVLFFDIGYSNEEEVDDINRRPTIYPHQLNILNYDTSLNPLSTNDISVSVQNNNVVLQSISLKKRIVPRYSSAYNYNRSDLSLFRFLMDIQGQGLSTNLMWKPNKMIPGLRFYPRVEFKNIIVAPAMWLLEVDFLKGSTSHDDEIKMLSGYLESKIDIQYFKVGETDQTLLFNKSCPEDIKLLLSVLKKAKSLYIEEAALPTKPIAFDASGNPILAQFNLTLQHTQQIVNKVSHNDSEDKQPKAKQWIGPGKEWLYFEIFGEPYRLETLFQQKILAFLKLNKRRIEKWFFIRYNEDGEHIRLRVKLKKPNDGYFLITELSSLLEDELNGGLISDIKIRTYKKEIHRYTTELMPLIEQHFCDDSAYVLTAARNKLSELQKCRLCMKILHSIRSAEILTPFEFDTLINKMTGAYNHEFKIKFEDFREVNKLYRSLQQEPLVLFPKRTAILFNQLKISFHKLIGLAKTNDKIQLLADLMHMHINRLFITDQRFMEMLIYNFFQLETKIDRKRGNATFKEEFRA